MPESMKVVTEVSPQGSTNANDWRSLLWTMLIMVASTGISTLIAWMTATLVPYLQENPSIGANVILAMIPTLTAILTMLGKYVQKLADGPTPVAAEQANLGITPKGYVAVSGGFEKVEPKKLA